MLAPVRTAAPTALVSLAEAKVHLVVDAELTEFDALISGFIATATQHFDGYSGVLGRALVTQTWRQDFCGFSGRMALPLGPAASISSVAYFDGSNATQTLAASVYGLFTDARGPYVGLKPDQVWPSSYSRPDAVSVTYVAGQDAADVDPRVKTAIMMLVASWFEHREAFGPEALTEIPFGVWALIAPLRRVGI
jgi:uncharacterized phiE125 gp8 family phage protein